MDLLDLPRGIVTDIFSFCTANCEDIFRAGQSCKLLKKYVDEDLSLIFRNQKEEATNTLLRLAEYNKDYANGVVKVYRALIEAGASVHALNDYALRWASHDGHTEIVGLLIEAGASVHARDNDALRMASSKGHS